MIDCVKITVTTTGSAGSATGTAYAPRPVNGLVEAVVVDWSSSAPNTSDIAVTCDSDDSHPAITLYSKANAVTDVTVNPQVQAKGTDGVAISAVYQKIAVIGRIKVAITDSDALENAATVYVYVSR